MSSKVNLIREVTRRLLLSLATLIVSSAVMLLVYVIAGKPVSVIAVVMAFGVLGGFVSVQRRLKQLTEDDLKLLASS